jgi:hypothetical protein
MDENISFAPPSGWSTTEVAPPTLSVVSGVAVDHWEAWRAPDASGGRAVSACLGLDLSAWADEATPIALDRLHATMTTVATALDPPMTLRWASERRHGAVVEQTFVDSDSGRASVVARTFVGFAHAASGPRLRGCFVLCAPTSGPCEGGLLQATAPSFVPPPAASVPLRVVVLGMHQPRAVAAGAVMLFFTVGLAALWTRPRPQRRTRRTPHRK